MSKNAKGYMGDQIGKLGPAVGRRWKGKMVYSAYQPVVRNPRTDRQLLVRARFTALIGLGRTFHTATLLGMASRARSLQITDSNLFFSVNYGAVSGTTPDALTVNYEQLKVAAGPVATVGFGAADYDTPQHIEVLIASDGLDQAGASTSDSVYLAACCVGTKACVVSNGRATRSDESVSLEVPSSWQGQRVHLYGFVCDTNGQASDSVYIGSGTVA